MQTQERQQGKQTHSLLRVFHSEGRVVKALGMKVQQEERAREMVEGPPVPHWSPPCKLLHERHQSTTYKPCGIQCNVSLFFSPRRGLRLELRNLGRLSHRYSWKPPQTPSFWQAQEPGHNGPSNTPMADWAPSNHRDTWGHSSPEGGRLLLRGPKYHRRNIRSERRVRWPEAETPRRGLRSTRKKENV